MENEEYYTAQEIADKLKVNIMTVYRHINSGKLSAIKTGKDFRVLKSDFESYLKNSQQRSVLEEKDNKILLLEKEIAKIQNNIKKQRYGLVWVDVPEAFEDDVENKLPILKEDKKLAIEKKNEKPTHILIEGDNYHALTCLNYTHKEKVDVIYIDPPYNTGSDGFRYKDKRILDKYPDGTDVPKDSPYRHSYWLSFMKKRLELSKNLLSDDGVIFISIDDNEMAQLKLLCDEVFNENNLIGIFTWVRKKKGSNLSKEFRKITEYILAYKRGVKPITLYGQKAYSEKQVPLLNRPNNISTASFPKDDVLVGRDMKDGKISKGNFGSGELTVELLNDIEIKDGKIITPFSLKGRFRWSQKTIEEELRGGSIFVVSNTFRINVSRHNQGEKFKSPSSLLTPDDGIGTNEDATEELRELFSDIEKLPFDYPKPVSLIKYLINSATQGKPSAVILDFFAGSGTTGHAVMDINRDEEKSKQFILCTNNEDHIIEEVCYPRLRKVIEGYKDKKPSENSLKYYRADFVGKNSILNSTDKDKIELAYNAGELLALAENTLYEQEKNDFYQIFRDRDRYTAIYFSEEMNKYDEFIQKVQNLRATEISVYVFSWEADEDIYEFEDLKNVRIKTIPQPIVEIYKQIYNLV
ncbi:MAG: DNA methyltransferase [Patescibacteria group bacterium]|nr:DNA methyltransferase [Patescibacteria group bacterium]